MAEETEVTEGYCSQTFYRSGCLFVLVREHALYYAFVKWEFNLIETLFSLLVLQNPKEVLSTNISSFRAAFDYFSNFK